MSATTMRSGDRQQQKQQHGKRNILSNAAYSIFNRVSSNSQSSSLPSANAGRKQQTGGHGLPAAGNVSGRRLTTCSGSSASFLQRSASADNVQIVRQRGFKPSDRHDPAKRNFLESLTSKILHFDMQESGNSTPINLQKLLTPATDSTETLHVRNKKMYASSYFYAPSHPTVEDQVELARRISSSLSDVKNVKSKGQSMYVNRKKRSVKWIHDGNGQEDEEEPASPISKDKVPLKCMMNPSGKVLDYHGIQALGEEPNIPQVPPHPERLYDIVRDLNNQKGRGAEIFAKRRKRSEKWVVDAEQPQSPSIYGSYGKYPIKQDIGGVNENLKFDNKPFYNPYDLSMDYPSPALPNCGHQCSRASFSSAHSDCGPCGPCAPYVPCIPYAPYVACGHEGNRKKKMYLRDEQPEKLLRRASFDGSRATYNPTRPCYSNGNNGYGRPARTPKAHQNGGGHYPHYQQQSTRANGYQHSGFNYLNGHELHQAGYPSRTYQQSGANGHQNGGAGYQNGNANGYHNGNGYQNGYQNGGGTCQLHPNQNGSQLEEDQQAEDYTPIPVKQLIQEFEKTCRPVMQFKQYPTRSSAAMSNSSQNDLSRYFESRRQVIYHNRRDDQQHRSGNGYASSAGDDEQDDDDDEEEEDEEDDDDDASLDDSLSPVDLYRIDQTTAAPNNRSSSMSTIDEYCRRQLQQHPAGQPTKPKFVDTEAEPPPGARAANLAALSQPQISAQKKALKKTPVLENLVAGTTTPECFKETFTEDIATKVSDNLYHGPKISSYQNLNNYNTAPRGWDQSLSVYRPVRFEKPQDTKISYSDF